ncbi:PH domain-containing protein [Kineococcus sp. NBC_00420]|uniref:PH domain-containing protein n=1 Tax=Kineococcus sp. NBC_00420 TaxID=2903564 RepID=UPI002E1AE93E
MNSPHDEAPDLTGLQPRYTWTTGRGVRALLFGSISVQALLAVTRLIGDPDTFDVVLAIIQLLFFIVFLGAYFVWTPSTTLTVDGVRLRNGFPKTRVVSWAQVRDVQVQGRRQDVSQLLLSDGRSERLIGMPVDDAQRLADALAARTAR